MNAEVLRRRAPLGLLAVDVGLLITVIWWGATLTERQEQISRRLQTMDGSGADRRLSVIEARLSEGDRRFGEIRAQMDRVEGKVDQLLVRAQ